MSYQPEFINSMLKMVIVLVFLLGGLWGLSLYLKKRYRLSGSFYGNKKIKVMETCPIGLKKSVCLVQVPGKIIVLAISGERITFLTTVRAVNIDETGDMAGMKT